MRTVITGLIAIIVLIVYLWVAALKARFPQGNNLVNFQFANFANFQFVNFQFAVSCVQCL